jgi:hypothetical protein
VAGGNEVEDLRWLGEVVRKEVILPLMIDSANAEALKAALAFTVIRNLPFSISSQVKRKNGISFSRFWLRKNVRWLFSA